MFAYSNRLFFRFGQFEELCAHIRTAAAFAVKYEFIVVTIGANNCKWKETKIITLCVQFLGFRDHSSLHVNFTIQQSTSK